MTFVLDASAVLRYLDREAGVDRVADILEKHFSRTAEALISSMHWAEIIGIFYKRHGMDGALLSVEKLRALRLSIIPVTRKRAEQAAKVRAEHAIPYVDSLAVALALEYAECVLITGDFDMKPAATFVDIEFLPVKPRQQLIGLSS